MCCTQFFRPVCIFDSGIGGINLLVACARMCPHTDFMYFADNFNVPYGSLPPERIRENVFAVFERIATFDPASAIVACNTATAVCIDDLRKKYTFPIVGIQPAVRQGTKVAGKCLVLATPATANSPSFARLCRLYGQGRVEVVAPPFLASYIEDNIFSYPDIDIAAQLPACSPGSVVLGCTHYVFAEEQIKNFYSCPVFDGILGTADHLKLLLSTEPTFGFSKRKVAFFGGDFQKNEKVFRLLVGKSGIN